MASRPPLAALRMLVYLDSGVAQHDHIYIVYILIRKHSSDIDRGALEPRASLPEKSPLFDVLTCNTLPAHFASTATIACQKTCLSVRSATCDGVVNFYRSLDRSLDTTSLYRSLTRLQC